jgi:tetratricopeptide (TPR) repeat protein
MVFGRQRAPRPRLAAASETPRADVKGSAISAVVIIAVALATLSLSSCGAGSAKRREAAFSSSLATIDSALASADPKGISDSFSRAYKYALSTSDWLCLLKRARAAQAKGDDGRYAGTADRAIKAFPRSDPVAAAAAHAYLRNGSPAKALALFGAALSAEARPKLWAEAFVSSMRDPGFEARPADYGRLAEVAEDPRPFIGAAVEALKAGDRISAGAWLEKALSGGAEAPPGLLWDCGLYDALARGSDASSGAAEIALMGDAAWMSGDVESAKRRWARSIALAPSLSWKPYANLALLSKGEAAVGYWSRLRAAFLSGPPSQAREGALASYSAFLAREGRDAEALAALKGGGAQAAGGGLAIMELTIRGRSMPEGRYVAELEGLAAERPGDPAIMGAALRALSQRGMFGELSVLRAGAANRKLPLEYGWFYEAQVSAARGNFSGAVSALKGKAGVEGAYALGSLYQAMGDPVAAGAEYSRAAAAARDGRSRCAAFKALGRELGASGDVAGATSAFKQALAADPSDAEAALLARSASKK